MFNKDQVTYSSQYQITNENFDMAMDLIHEEYDKAIKKFPWWPINIQTGEAIVSEENGEAQKAALDYQFKSAPLSDVIQEHAQAAAMHIRQIQHLMNIDTDGENNGTN